MTPEERRRLLQEISHQLEEAAAPLDLEKLEAEGVIERQGGWYKARNLDALPTALRIRIAQIQPLDRGVKVRFKRRNPFEKLSREYKKLLE